MTLKANNIVVSIREADCIGCTKCIQACPVDAILGSHKLMHTVIADECIGCKLCIEPCPVDCIDIVALTAPREKKPDYVKKRYRARSERLAKMNEEAVLKSAPLAERKAYLQAALARKGKS